MKINQFGVIETTFEQKINELTSIGFYDEKIQAAISKGSVPLLQALLEGIPCIIFTNSILSGFGSIYWRCCFFIRLRISIVSLSIGMYRMDSGVFALVHFRLTES